MSNTNKRLVAGTLADSNATLYTVPGSTKTIVKSVMLCNKTGSNATVTLKLDGIHLLYAFTIAAGETYLVSSLDQLLDAAELIEGSAGTASAIDFSISGIEVT